MNKQSGSDWKDTDLVSIINDVYNHIFMKENISFENNYILNYFIKILIFKISLFKIGHEMILEKKIIW